MDDYKIGLIPGSLVTLQDQPFPDTVTNVIGFTLAGSPISAAVDTITWRWQNMSQVGWYQILLFWATNIQAANPPPWVYIQSLREDGATFSYGTFRCRMGRPTSTVTAPVAEIRNAEVKFYHCELYEA